MYLGDQGGIWRAWSESLPPAPRNYAPVTGEILEGLDLQVEHILCFML